ncbi:MAG: tRNA lysidine(34) synthetase TilS, partial [Myxococcales bacterium]
AIDPSNSDIRYTRARLRHHILPLLRQENPRVDVALRTLAAAVATEFKTEDPNTESGPEGSLDANAERSRDDLHIPTRMAAQIEDAVRDGRGTRRFDLPAGLRVQVAYGQVTMAHVTKGGTRPSVGSYDDGESGQGRGGTAAPVSLPGPGTYPFGAGVRIQILEAAGELDAEPDNDERSGFDADLLSWPLVARPRRPGDRMSPRGGVGSRKLSDLMIDAKIPRGERASLPVITAADGELLFVPGLRPSRRGCPTLATMRRIGLAVLPKPDHDGWIDGQVDRSIRRGDTGRYRCQDRHPPAPAGQAESEETGAGLQSCSSQSAKRSGTNPAKKTG